MAIQYTNVEPKNETTPEPPKPRRRGFAAMSPEKVREIASKGGKAAHACGRGHQFTKEEAQAAGRKGGSAKRRNRKNGNAILPSDVKDGKVRIVPPEEITPEKGLAAETYVRQHDDTPSGVNLTAGG